MTIEDQITILEHNAEYERRHFNLEGCLYFRQLVEWLKDYQRLLETNNVCRWIPVSERLPNKDKNTYYYKCLVAVRCTSRYIPCDTLIAYFDGNHFYSSRFDTAFMSGVKAWMPLPEPYKKEGD